MAGYVRTALLLAGLTALFMGAGFLLGGTGAYWNSDKMVLRMYGAQPVDRASHPEFYDLVAALARQADLPMPKVYIIDEAQPNAFATGRNPENAAVAATTGLLRELDANEVAGVMAHELAHVKNHDTLIMTITATIAGALSMLANFALFFGGNRDNPLGIFGTILVMIFAPMAAMLVQMAISRSREYEADRIGAEICGQPMWLAGALDKLDKSANHIDNLRAEDNPATAHMFIVNPLHARSMDNLFSTHPSMANRIKRLSAMTPNRTAAEAPPAATPPASDVPASGRRSSSVPHTRGRPRGPWS